MLTSERERRICEKYSAMDEAGFVHCRECPLSDRVFDMPPLSCKKLMHYDRRRREWVYDEEDNDGM